MLISVNWLRELVEIPENLTNAELGRLLTMSGLEIETASDFSLVFAQMVVAKVNHIAQHPSHELLRVCQIDDGILEKTVVCGARNFEVGQFVVYAPIGSTLKDGLYIEKKTIQGIESFGMLCSEREIGLSSNHSGILVLQPSEIAVPLEPGMPLAKALSMDGDVFELKITPNRADALSHLGVARELSAVLKTRLKSTNTTCTELGGLTHDAALVTILDKEACPRYACRVIEEVKVGPSPLWIKNRLIACGIRPINNVVDITNLILLERGQPLHAFDWGRLQKDDRHRATLTIRRAKTGEKLQTLDGQKRSLYETDLIIADANNPVALAGIMGGQLSEVSETTTTLLVESAHFTSPLIRQTAQKHALRTESSYRFERGCDPNQVVLALDRACDLIAKATGGRIRREIIDIYPKKIEPILITLNPKKVADISGLPEPILDEASIRNWLMPLGIETEGKKGDALTFRVPTFRPDLTREIDLIEEIMRLIGYDKVPSRLVFRQSQHVTSEKPLEHTLQQLEQVCLSAGFSQCVNLPFGSFDNFQNFEPERGHYIQIQNPLGVHFNTMRRHLLPGILQNMASNFRKEQKNIRLFESGRVFLERSAQGEKPNPSALSSQLDADAFAIEKHRFAAACTGKREAMAFDIKPKDLDFYDLKGLLEACLAEIKSPTLPTFKPVHEAPEYTGFLHPNLSASIWVGQQYIGYLGQLHPHTQNAFELECPIYVLEMDLEAFSQFATPLVHAKELPRYPSIQRDLAIVVNQDLPVGELLLFIKSHPACYQLLEHQEVFDIYTGKGIPKNKKSVAISLLFRSLDRTLTDAMVQNITQTLLEDLSKQYSAHIREG